MDQEKRRIHQFIREILEQKEEKFIPGKTVITTGQAVYDHREINAIIDSLLQGWFGLAGKGIEFENLFSKYVGNEYSILVNSGSSANLLALNGMKELLGLQGGEIITPACTFPATVNPIIQLGFQPAFVDVDKTLNVTPELITPAINSSTRGIIFAHAMGNPARIDEIMDIARRHDLFVIEDCCAALGSRYDEKLCGTFGIASTYSFYPSHGITLGEGGAVATNNHELNRIIRSLRDWGRDCICRTDQQSIDGECGKRFEYQMGETLYDHRYVYSQIGYNLKPLELQAAMGIEQLKKLDEFNAVRKRNFALYKEGLSPFDKFIALPEVYEKSEPVFFGLPIIIKHESVDRRELITFLNRNKVATRLYFAGNIVKQPAYKNIDYAVYGELSYTDKIFRDCFWIGLHQGVAGQMIEYVISVFEKYFKKLS